MLLGLALAFTAIGFWEYQARELLLNPKVIASNQVEEYFRVNSLFFDPNIYGRFLALVMIAVAGVLLWTRRARDAYLAAAVLAVLWGGLLLTLSQSSFAALLVGLAVLALLRYGWLVVAPIVVVAGIAAVILVVAFPHALRVDLGSSESLDKATSGRYDLINGGLSLGRERPLAGWGSGSFERQFRRHEQTSVERAQSASHTIPITVVAEQGAIGLLAYLALLVVALARLLSRREPLAGARGRGGRIRRADRAHLDVRRVPRGSGDVDAAGDRHRARRRGAAADGQPGPGAGAAAPQEPAPPVPAPAKT